MFSKSYKIINQSNGEIITSLINQKKLEKTSDVYMCVFGKLHLKRTTAVHIITGNNIILCFLSYSNKFCVFILRCLYTHIDVRDYISGSTIGPKRHQYMPVFFQTEQKMVFLTRSKLNLYSGTAVLMTCSFYLGTWWRKVKNFPKSP